jgi:hypothetical protein
MSSPPVRARVFGSARASRSSRSQASAGGAGDYEVKFYSGAEPVFKQKFKIE